MERKRARKRGGNMATTNIAPGQNTVGNRGEIRGQVFYDTSRDAAHQSDEKWIEGVTVQLWKSNENKQPIVTGPPVQTQLTREKGTFLFEHVEPGNWFVQLSEELDPTTLNLKPPGLPKLRLSEPSEAMIYVPVVAGRPSDLGAIGYEAHSGAVHGILFYDQNDSHSPDKNPRLADVNVWLQNLGKKTTAQTQTNAQGVYTFNNPEAGLYLLRFEPTVDATRQHLGKGSLKLPKSLPHTFHIAPGEDIEHNLGYLAMGGDIHVVVFQDEDGNGRRLGNEPGIPGVPVVLVDTHNQVLGAEKTTSTGELWFQNIAPGTYTLRFDDPFNDFTLTTPATQPVTVRIGETAETRPTSYQPETHEIRGRVVFADRTPVRQLVVTLADEQKKDIDTTETDDEGNYVFKNRRGTFIVKFPDPPFSGQLLTPKEREAQVHSIFRVPETRYRLTSGDGDGTVPVLAPASGTVQDAVLDIASYMPTSQEVIGPVTRPGGYGTTGGPAPLKQMVDTALLEVLGRKLKTDDPKAFLTSLDRSFTLEQFEGHTLFKWTPRTYAVQTELGGGITGAQASIYHRAKAALDDALPLLDGLYPLLPAPDLQEVEAARAIIRTEFIELVNELGVEGGPRVQRVDDTFSLLRQKLDDVEKFFGFTRDNVITVEEEQNLTNFLVIRDYIGGLEAAWSGARGFRSEFVGTGPKFLGTQLVLLSRALSVVAESVDEAYLVMDSVFLGPSERQTVRIDFPSTIRIDDLEVPILIDTHGRPVQPPPMLVDELLSWVMRFAADEGPQLIQEGGKRGVAAIQPTAQRLQRLVLGASQAKVQHVGFSRTRVRRSLMELAVQLGLVERLARELLQKVS